MKNSAITLILAAILCLQSLVGFSSKIYFPKDKNPENDSTVCLEINGKIRNLNTADNSYKVELISCNNIVESLTIKKTNHFSFHLKRNTHYAIRISKKGFITRLVSIHTSLPVKNDGIYRFEFDTELIGKSEVKKLDSDALDFPIAVISFNDQMKCFYYNEEYTAKIKRSLYLKQKF